MNDYCSPDCPIRNEHIKYLAMEQLNKKEITPYFPCPMPFNCDFEYISSNKNFITSYEAYKEYTAKGVKYFRISGGSCLKFLPIYNKFSDLIKFYIYYMIKEEYQDKITRIILQQLKYDNE